MALLDFLKRKKETEKAREKKADKKNEEKSGEVKVEKKSEVKEIKSNKKTGTFSYSAIREPHISEKGSILAETQNQYVFNVLSNSNKAEIKKSIEGVYGVNVLSVNIIKIPAKKRRIGRTQGFKKSYIKAIVKLREGDKIEIL